MMRWRLLSIGRTDVLLHPAVLLCFLYAALTGHGAFMLTATLSILLHECAHAVTAALCGQAPRTLELTPLGAVMHLDDENRLPPLKRMLMLLAGPGMTLLLCLLSIRMTAAGVISTSVGRLIFLSNLSILVLNLLPAFPLDGGRVLSMLLLLVLPMHIAGRVMRAVGTLLGAGLIALNVYISWKYGGWNLSLAFAGCCLLYSAVCATTTQAMAELRRFLDRRIMLENRGRCRLVTVATMKGRTLRQLLRDLHPRHLTQYAIFEPGTMRLLGMLTEFEAAARYASRPDMTCGEALTAAGLERTKSAQK